MLFPSQGYVRGLFNKPPDLFADPDYQGALKRLCAVAEPTCRHCGFSGLHDDLARFSTERGGEGPLPPGFGLFQILSKDLNAYNLEAANLDLVCEPCFHARQLFIPGIALKGDIGLCNALPQSDIINMWRVIATASSARISTKVRTLEMSYSHLSKSSQGAFKSACGERANASLPVNNQTLAYWAGHAEEYLYDAGTKVLTDLRFFPSSEMFFDHLAFCSEYHPIDITPPATAVPAAS